MTRPVDTAGSDPRPGETVPDSGRELTREGPNAVWEPVVSLPTGPTESVAVSTDVPENENEPVAPAPEPGRYDRNER